MRKIWITLIPLLFATQAHAKVWQVDYLASKITFQGIQSGAAFTGSFGKFTASIDFDEKEPSPGKITATIDLASALTNDKDRDGALPSADWFDVKKTPTATFESTLLRKTAEGTYEAHGNLTIKGLKRQIMIPFTLTKEKDTTRALGEFTLNRLDYNLGTGQYADTKWVAQDVLVKINIVAK